MQAELADAAIATLQQVTGDEDDFTAVDTALATLRDVTRDMQDKDGQWAMYLIAFAAGSRMRFELLGEPGDIENALVVIRQAIDEAPAELHVDLWSDVMDSLWLRVRFFGDRQDVDEAMECAQFVLPALAEDDDLLGIQVRMKYADMLDVRYSFDYDLADLDEAITLWRRLLQCSPLDDEDRPTVLATMGHALHVRYERQRRPADLDEALSVLEQAMAYDHPLRGRGAYELSSALLQRFWARRDPDDIDAAAEVARQEISRGDEADLPAMLSVLSSALSVRFEIHREMSDLTEAIDAGRSAVAGLPDGHPDESMYRVSVANRLRLRWVAKGVPEDLDEAIDWGRQAVALLAEDNPTRPQSLYNLSNSLRGRGTPADLDEAVEASRIASAAMEHPYRGLYLHELCMSLFVRFGHSGDVGDLAEAIAAGSTALDLPSAPPQLVALLVDVLFKRYEVDSDPEDLDQAITLARSASTAPAATPPLLFKLANMLWARFDITLRVEDRDEAIAFGRQAVIGDPDSVPYRRTLIAMLQARFAAAGRVGDLDESVDLARQVVAIAADEEGPLASLTGALWARWRSVGERADLDETITTGAKLVAAVPADDEDLTLYQGSLGHAYRDRYEHYYNPADRAAAEKWERLAGVERHPYDDAVGPGDGDGWASKRGLQGVALLEWAVAEEDPAALNHAIILIEQAIELFSAGHPARLEAMANLTSALWMRFVRIGDLADLDKAIDTGRAAVSAGGGADVQASLGGALLARFIRFSHLSDVDEAIIAGRVPVDGAERLPRLSNLSISLRARYLLTNELPDLLEAVEVGRAALAVVTEDSKAIPLANLAATVLLKFRQLGDRADLDEAVSLGRAAAAASPPGHPDRAAPLENLSSALRERSEWSTDQADLDEAIEMGRAAVAASPPGYGELPMYLSDLGNALRQRYIRTGDLADLDEGIAVSRAAVDASPAGHPERPRYLSNLAVQLRQRFADLGERSDLTAAVEFVRQAVATSPAGHPEHPKYLMNLAWTLLAGDSNVDEAIELSRAALDGVPAESPGRATYLMNLATALHSRFNTKHEISDLDEAIALARASVDDAPAGHHDTVRHLSVLNELLLSRGGATKTLTDVDEAITMARDSVELVGDLAIRADLRATLARGLRLRFDIAGEASDVDEALSVWRQVAHDRTASPPVRLRAGVTIGALAALRDRWSEAVDGYAIAIDMLPLAAWRGSGRQSREHLLAQWSGLASEAASCAIASGQPDRAVELLEHGRGVLWSQILDTRTDITALRDAVPALAARLRAVRAELDAEQVIDRRMSLSVQWDTLIREIRTVEGFSSFLRPPTVDSLRVDGLVVIINASQWRCDAILVDANETKVVELSTMTADDVVEHATAYLNALLAVESGDIFDEAERDLTTTLEWLWDHVAAPVLEALDDVPTRLWWCPTGPFSLLPLHAAGYHDERAGRTVLDRVISSYTPTLRSLVSARSAGGHPADNRLLIVAMPETPGQPPLPDAARERDHLTRLFAAPRHTLTQGPAATHDTVREHLRKHAWAHFSCHGDQQLNDPSNGGLLLHDGILTVAELANDRYRGEFAFLSACKTAVGGVQTPDEAITLAAALQYTGWRHVIGTLWTVWDQSAADIAIDVYDHMAANGELRPHDAAQALHNAVRRQREATTGRPSNWAPFIHIGP